MACADPSYRRAAEAWDAGKFNDEIVPVTVKSKKGDVEVSVDEEYKGLKLEKVPQLKPVFKYPPSNPIPPLLTKTTFSLLLEDING